MEALLKLKRNKGATKTKKRLGRGNGSGLGTYSGRGGKGQTARTGHSKMPIGFEGGRQPLIRQVPKSRGFTSLNDKAIAVSISSLNVFGDGDTVTVQALIDKGVIKTLNTRSLPKVKLLKGEIKRKLTIRIPVSSSAKELIEKAGGTVK
jgi:large subunit ribosomal protein L15